MVSLIRKVLSIFTLMALFVQGIGAKDFGVVGPVKAIAERDMLEQIAERLEDMKHKGEFEDIQADIIEESKKQAARPVSYHHLSRAQQEREYSFDPSFVVKEDIVNHQGTLIAKAGTHVNPFNYIAMSESLLFINSDDKAQMDYASSLIASNRGALKIVLTNGNVEEAAKRLNRAVYFDQKGLLVERLSIAALPAIVYQKEDVLQIREVVL